MFAKWAAGRLQLEMGFDGAAYSLRPVAKAAEGDQTGKAPRSGLGSSLLSRRKRASKEEPAGESYDAPAALAAELLARLDAADPLPDLAPASQPERVHELAPRLLDAYQVDDGRLHIAGCHFQDAPFLRVTRLKESGDEPSFHHTLYDADGQPVDDQLAQQLGLTATRDLDYHPPGAADIPAPPSDGGPDAPRRTAVVWAKRVTGNLQFTIGDATLKAPFSGWAATLAPPSVVCPHTGRETFHLGAVDGLGIAAAEEIDRCEESGRAVLKQDLVTCAATGKRVAPDLCEPCPVSGEPTLKKCFVACTRCGQRVGQASQRGGRCTACRQMRRVRRGDPSLAAILAAHPTLGQLRGWRLSETNAVYLLQGRQLLARYLFVIGRQDLAVQQALRLLPLGGSVELSAAERLALLAS